MKAVAYHSYGPPDVVGLDEIPEPVPKDDELLIRVVASAVSRSECELRKGDSVAARLFNGLRRPRRTILGSDLAGEVISVGEKVVKFEEGDSVVASMGAGFGAHVAYACVSETSAVVPKPEGVTFEAAAGSSDGMLTALPFLRDKAHLGRGQSLLVNGASGSVGTAAVQLGKLYGAQVTGVCSTSNVGLVTSLGADTVIDYTKEDFTRASRTYDVIFDAVGKSSFTRCRNSLKSGGVYLSTVLSAGICFQMMRTAIVSRKRATIAFAGLRSPQARARDLAYLVELLATGKIRAVIDDTYPPERAADAHRYVDTGRKKGGIVLDWRSTEPKPKPRRRARSKGQAAGSKKSSGGRRA